MRNRLLTGILSVALVFTSIVQTEMQVQASELVQFSIEREIAEASNGETETAISEEGEVEDTTDNFETVWDEETDLDGENTQEDNRADEDNSEAGAKSGDEASEETVERLGEISDEESGEVETGNVNEENDVQESNNPVGTISENSIEEIGRSVMATSVDDIASGTYENITWKINADGKLTVEGTGEFYLSSSGYQNVPWYSDRDSIKSAEINVTGTKNASFMFYGCCNMTSVDLSRFDTSNVTDMCFMFSGCSSLTKLDVRNFNTKNVTNMNNMFSDCSSLTELDVRNFDTKNVINMDDMFSYCSSLTELDLNNFNTQNVTGMDDMFRSCSSLRILNLSGLNTENVTDMSYMFWSCSSLISLDVSGLNTKNVTDMNGMFTNCSSLTELDVSNFDTSNVTGMWHMFSGCSSLTELDVSNFDTKNVTSMNRMFGLCSSLTELDVSNFDTSNVINMSYLFGSCSGLTELDVSNFDTKKVTDMSYMFFDCDGLSQLNVSNFNTSSVVDMEYMFNGCIRLEELNVSEWNTQNVKNMNAMFQACICLRELDLSSFNAGNIEEIDLMLNSCLNLSTIYTPFNLTRTVILPTRESTDIWYCSGGKQISELPQNLSYSIMITKNKKPEIPDPYITVTKTKTHYKCGETINTDDIIISYYDSNGIVTKITEGYSTNISEINMSVPGIKELKITYQDLTETIELSVIYVLTEDAVSINLPTIDYIYNGFAQKPVPEVMIAGKSNTLIRGIDYTVSYEDNVNAGNTAKVIITGINDYTGTLTKSFIIEKAELEIAALDMILAVGDGLPNASVFEYQVTGLLHGDKLITQPSFMCDVTDMQKTGIYKVIPYGADAGSNYTINYSAGTLMVEEERVVYTVAFDMQGHGTTLDTISGIKAGSLVEEPDAPIEIGYIFAGWYKDKACTKIWDFETDTVQQNIILYACWLTEMGTKTDEDMAVGTSLYIQEIQNQTYTGSVLKPAVKVYAADGKTLLKSGKDYTIKYFNNIETDTDEEANAGGISGSGNEGDNGFTKNLAYVVITGKGNYKGILYSNFHIIPAAIGDSSGNAANGITLKYTEQLVRSTKAQKPFSSLKYKKSMKVGTDFTIALTALEAYDAQGNILAENSLIDSGNTTPAIPAGYTGTFRLNITGINNYEGTIVKTIYVSDKNHLMKNASITLGKNLKSVPYTGEEITLTPGYYDTSAKKYYAVNASGTISTEAEANANSIFTVKFGKKYLICGEDYIVSYSNNKAVGTATMTLTGIGEYTGTKSVTFKIKGTAFNAKNIVVEGLKSSMVYTGKSLTQNGVTLKTKDGTELVYGRHYSISYTNNLKKGTAKMTFTAKVVSGYSGSFTKTFKITAAQLTDAVAVSAADITSDSITNTGNVGMVFNGTVAYTKEGAKPIDRICLTSQTTGTALKAGTDYTVSYANNMAVTTNTTATSKLPTMKIKGKGNYAGTLNITFAISEASMQVMQQSGSLKVTAASTAFNAKKTDTYQYQPKIKVTDGKKTLSAKKDYTVSYENCSQEKVKEYLEALANGTAQEISLESMRPRAVITAVSGSNYTGSVTADLEIFGTKLTSGNLYVIVSEEYSQTTYTIGSQITPEVTVYYGETKAVKAAKNAKITDKTTLTDQSGSYKLTELNLRTEGTGDYILTYGANVTAGKNKGTVTVTGTGLYGGSVTTKFTILSRDVYAFR